MGQSMGMLDFFVLEAGEYLGRLDALAQTPAGPFPDAEEFVRIVRAYRGSALMASQRAMARGAQGLEAVGRAVRDGRVAWDERIRGEVVRAVDDCRKYLHRIRTPEADDAARAEEMGAALERLAGRTSTGVRAAGSGLDAGGRAFVAREAAAIASTLDRTAQALVADPAGRDALGTVAPAMSALRGVALLNDLPPLADILVGVEGALKEVLATSGAVGPAVPAVFDAAAKALARAAREVVDIGRPAADSEQAGAFASLLLSAFAGAGDILPIEALYYQDAGPHVVHQGAAPAALSRVEIVSQGEFLERAAEELSRAASPILLDLRLFGMAATLRPLAGVRGSPLSAALGRVADVGRAAIDRGSAADHIGAFAAAIAEIARALRAAETTDEAILVAQLDAVTAQLGALVAPAAAPRPDVPPAAPARPRTTRMIPELAPESAGEPARAAASMDDGDLAASYATLERLITERGLPLGSLDELLGAPTVVGPAAMVASREDVVRIGALAPDAPREAVVPIEALAPDEGAIVPIESLLYRGPGALRRALELKGELAALAASPNSMSPRLLDLQREVFDLVELGLGAQR